MKLFYTFLFALVLNEPSGLLSETITRNACLTDVLKYTFQSSLISASNASKVLNYRAEVYLHCRGQDSATSSLPKTHYMLWFESLETSINDYVRKTNVQPRRRKLPPNLVRTEDPENPTTESLKQSSDDSYKTDEDANNTIGKWFELPRGPVLFDRLPNGTISSITFNRFDADHEKLVSIKRAIVFAFQTAYPIETASSFTRTRSVPEYDELGYHFTSYKYETVSAGGLDVTKQASTDDFIEMQRDTVNGGMLSVNTMEKQRFEIDGVLQQYTGRISVEMMQTTHPTQVYSVDEDLKAQVAIDSKSNLTLVERLAANSQSVAEMLRGARNIDWDHSEKPADVLDIKDDPTAHIADIFSKIEPTLYAKGIETILDEFIETPRDQKILKPLRRALALEAELFYAGKTKVRKVYDMAMPSIKKVLKKCESMQSWSLCLSFLDLAVSASGNFAHKTLLSYLENDQIPNIYRVQLLNMVIFMTHPSDFLVSQMISQHRAGEMFDDDELEFRNHLLLAIGSTGSRSTVTRSVKVAVAEYLNKVITEKFANETCNIGSTQLLSLSAAGNFLSPAVVTEIGDPADRFVSNLLRIAQMCRDVDDIAITGLAAVSKLYSVPSAMKAMLAYLNGANCVQKALLVGHLMKTMQFDVKVWPAKGVNEIDEHFARLLMFQPETVSCGRDIFEDYFTHKKLAFNSVAWQRTFGNLRSPTTVRPVQTTAPRRRLLLPSFLTKTDEKTSPAIASSNSTELSRTKRASGNGYSYNVYTTDWKDYDNMFTVIQSPSQFQTDINDYPTNKHILYDLTGGTNFFAAYMRAGFFTGKNSPKSTCKLFGRLVVNVQLGIVISVLDVAFMREQTQSGFYGYTRLTAIGFTYMFAPFFIKVSSRDLPQYTCNITIDQWSYAYQFALPVYTVSFGGFSLNMNADLEVRLTLYLWPSYCLQGDIGIMFKPTAVIAGNAFAELANTYFGIGLNAQLFFDYFLELSLRAPDGCIRLYHGNDDMSFTINIYLKLPTFIMKNINPNPSVSLIIWNVFQWLLRLKSGGKWTLFGWCPVNFFTGPETPTWNFDNSI